MFVKTIKKYIKKVMKETVRNKKCKNNKIKIYNKINLEKLWTLCLKKNQRQLYLYFQPILLRWIIHIQLDLVKIVFRLVIHVCGTNY